MNWEKDVSSETRTWLETLGGFSPTVHVADKELKGYLHCDDGDDGSAYITAKELREIATACEEAANWLDERYDLRLFL